MLLRASSEHSGDRYDFEAISGDEGDGGVPHGRLLMDFADAVVAGDDDALALAREAVAATLGEDAVVDSAAICATFNTVDRVADATGIPLEDDKAEATTGLRASIGIDRYPSTAAAASAVP